jgi:hypothetical protein
VSLTAAFLLAATTAQAAPGGMAGAPDRGAQVETARVSVTILRPAVVKGGTLIESHAGATPHSQRLSRDGRVTYEFE